MEADTVLEDDFLWGKLLLEMAPNPFRRFLLGTQKPSAKEPPFGTLGIHVSPFGKWLWLNQMYPNDSLVNRTKN